MLPAPGEDLAKEGSDHDHWCQRNEEEAERADPGHEDEGHTHQCRSCECDPGEGNRVFLTGNVRALILLSGVSALDSRGTVELHRARPLDLDGRVLHHRDVRSEYGVAELHCSAGVEADTGDE